MTDKYVAPDLGNLPTYNIGLSPCADNMNTYMEALAAEQLEVGGAPINVFRLLGVHEQGKLIDLTGSGAAISSGTMVGYLASSAFNDDVSVWRSAQIGTDVLQSFIGYNFGTKKSLNGLELSVPPAPIRQHITTIKIKQSVNVLNRVIQARIERSNDGGTTWQRADVVNLPDTTEFETINLRPSNAAQMWRIVPLMFNGMDTTEPWEVEELEFIDYIATSIDNIQDELFMENRDREYSPQSVQLKAQYDLVDVQTELTKFGIDLPSQYYFTLSFARMIELLGRPIVIGDLVEVPSEMQYDHNMNPIRKWLEVTDATWSTDGFTPGWKPILFRVTAQPAIGSQENSDIFGTPNTWGKISDDDFLANQLIVDNTPHKTAEFIKHVTENKVPETGTDMREFTEVVVNPATDSVVNHISINDLYAEDGLPPGGLPYTEGFTFPVGALDGSYHRLTYDPSTQILTKLFRWSAVKSRWIFQETDKRTQQSSHRPSVSKILMSGTSITLSGK